MAVVLTCTNQKGGVAKTTTNWAVADCLRKRGYKTLMVDLDPQSNLTLIAGADSDGRTIKDVFDKTCSVEEAIVTTEGQGDILPSTLLLASADNTYNSPGREYMLSIALNKVKDRYDFILVDTPPSIGVLVFNALTAADHVIVPIATDVFSFVALEQLSQTLQAIVDATNPHLSTLGIVITNYVGRSNHDKNHVQVVRDSEELLNARSFDTLIRYGSVVREAELMREPLSSYAPRSKQAADYEALTDEILGRINNDQ